MGHACGSWCATTAKVEADRSAFLTSDRVAVKATVRAGFGFVHPQSIIKVSTV
jgi:hypothetical protein